jgi:DNA-binding response OmpR family regulator
MMPVYDGWEVLKEIRHHSDVPVLMLTALGDERNEVKGLSDGADDYIAKPFSYPVFTARVEALLRKTKRQHIEKLSAGEIIIDRSAHKVWVADEEIVLNNKEYSLLAYLLKNSGLVLDRDKILENVWGYDFEGDIRTIDAHIKMLRSKLGLCGGYIKTIRGTGYLFEVDYEKEYSQ